MGIKIISAGVARSGSTLLASILGASPNVKVIGEIFYFNSIVPKGAQVGDRCLAAEGLRSHLDSFATKWWIVEKKFDIEKIFRSLQGRLPCSYVDVYFAILGSKFEGQKYSHVLEKTISNIKWFEHLGVDNTKLVITIRDPRAVYASWKKSNTTIVSLSHFITEWRCVAEFPVKNPAVKVILVKYEDIVENRSGYYEGLFSEIDVDYSLKFLSNKVSINQTKEQSHHVSSDEAIHSKSLNSWESDLHEFEKRIISIALSEEMSNFGYGCGTCENLGLVDKLILMGSKAIYPLKRSVRVLRQLSKKHFALKRLGYR